MVLLGRFLLLLTNIVCGDSVFDPCFVMQYLVSFLVLQSSVGTESMLPFLNGLPDVLWLLVV